MRSREERLEARQALRRQHLLQTAREVLVARGVAGFTIAAVAEAAGLSKAAVFYWFSSKEDLVGALAAEVLAAEADALCAAIDAAPSGRDGLAALVKAKVDFYERDPDAFRLLYLWPQVLGLDARWMATAIYPQSRRVNDRLEARLLADQTAGLVHPRHVARVLANAAWIAAHGLVSLTLGLRELGGDTLHTREVLQNTLVDLLVSGAAAPPPPQAAPVLP